MKKYKKNGKEDELLNPFRSDIEHWPDYFFI